jgi:predicted GIY-YIG superfamily endonuclease
MMEKQTFYYVYILRSLINKDRFYSGYSTDLESRLKEHNKGGVPSTKPYTPWEIKTFVAFTDEQQARNFERYLKTQSGRAFAKKRL